MSVSNQLEQSVDSDAKKVNCQRRRLSALTLNFYRTDLSDDSIIANVNFTDVVAGVFDFHVEHREWAVGVENPIGKLISRVSAVGNQFIILIYPSNR